MHPAIQLRLGLVLATAAAAVFGAPAVATARPQAVERGFVADEPFLSGSDAERAFAYARARDAGGSLLRINAYWSSIAPDGTTRPVGFVPSDPADPRYRWGALDRVVRESTAAGLEPIVLVVFAPRWAEGRNRPAHDPLSRPGTWRPSPHQLGLFLTAAARRYSGTFPDPARPGAALPRVRDWQVWNEENLWPFLRPQWERRGKGWHPFAASHYARMLDAAYTALKGVDSSNRVIMGGLAPFGSRTPARSGRTQPLAFLRRLFCLGRDLRRTACRVLPRLDVYAHHPSSRGGPTRGALNPGDATFPELGEVTRIFRAAERAGTSLPAHRKPFWVTEMGWDSNPPDPAAVSARTQARWLDQAFYVLWKHGVERVVNLQLRDAPLRKPAPGQIARQAGIFFRGATIFADRPKPAYKSYRFPFVVDRAGSARARAWGLSPCTCLIRIERASGGGWTRVRSVSAQDGHVFVRTVAAAEGMRFRARQEGDRGVRSPIVAPARL